VLQAAGLLFFAFAGYARIATLGEEVRDPATTIPKAVRRALAFVLGVYMVVGVSVVASVPVAALADSDASLRVVVEASSWSVAGPVVRVGAAVATLGVLLNLVPGVSRTVLAMARRRDLPAWFDRVDGRRNLPVRAESLVVATVVALVALVGIRSAIAVSGTAVLTYYAVTNAAALTLPGDQLRSPRWIPWTGLVGCIVLVAALPWRAMASGAAVVLVGVAVRFVVDRHRPAPPADTDAVR
jgi:APA family basic amino acid/polyamine antiporter